MAEQGQIEVHLRDPSQLFQTADPFPFSENGLEPDAERFFLRQARESPRRAPLTIVVHLARSGTAPSADDDLPAGLHRRLISAFEAAADGERRAMYDHFRTGRRMLMIGLGVLAACLLLASQSQSLFGDGVSARLVQESSVVFGWVAMWRPAEIFLYDWLPMRGRLVGLRRLAMADVQVVETKAP